MQFIDYLKSQNLSLAEVARDWGVAPSTLSRPAKGERLPGIDIIVRAYVLSDGIVSLPDWIETCRPLLETSGAIPRKPKDQ